VLAAEHTEIEGGRRTDNRPQLAACKRLRAKLIVAKLDRLSRNVGFICALLNSGVEFVAADMPHANKMTLQVLAVFAEHERDQISARTKQALAALSTLSGQRPQSSSASRRTASQAGFLLLIQCGERPERWWARKSLPEMQSEFTLHVAPTLPAVCASEVLLPLVIAPITQMVGMTIVTKSRRCRLAMPVDPILVCRP
jgi:Resolvase, N terminal domain